MKTPTQVSSLFFALFLVGCSSTGPHNPSSSVLSTNNCIANLIDSAKYDNVTKRELKPELSASFPGVGTGAVSFASVSSNAIHLQVERSKDPFERQMALAINLAQCMDEKALEYFASTEFRNKPESERSKIKADAFAMTSGYRTRVLDLILQKRDIEKGIVPKGNLRPAEALNEARAALENHPDQFSKELVFIKSALRNLQNPP